MKDEAGVPLSFLILPPSSKTSGSRKVSAKKTHEEGGGTLGKSGRQVEESGKIRENAESGKAGSIKKFSSREDDEEEVE